MRDLKILIFLVRYIVYIRIYLYLYYIDITNASKRSFHSRIDIFKMSSRQLRQALISAETFRQYEHLDGAEELPGLLEPAGVTEAEHARVTCTLTSGDLVLRVAGKTWE